MDVSNVDMNWFVYDNGKTSTKQIALLERVGCFSKFFTECNSK